MTDLISRQAAIEAIKKWEASYTWDEFVRNHNDNLGYYAPSDVVKELPSAQQWIPYSKGDEVPLGRYLVQCENGEMHTGSFTAWGWMFGYYVPHVVAYMPLPEPYKEKET